MYFDEIRQIAAASLPLLLQTAALQKKMYAAALQGVPESRTQQLLEKRKALQQKLSAANPASQSGSLLYWWMQPWEAVLRRLDADTKLLGDCEEDAYGWEWEEELRYEKKDDLHYLSLFEHGRKAGHAVLEDSWESGVRSRLSAEDEKEMIERHQNDLLQRTVRDLSFDDGRPVRSLMSDEVYDNMTDYYASAEHAMYRNMEEDVFRSSIYEDYATHIQRMASANLHYRRISAIGVFHVAGDGTLDLLQPLCFSPAAETGDPPEQECSRYEDCNSAVFCAAYIAKHHLVRSVPISLICRTTDGKCESEEEAVTEAEMFACLGDLLK